MSTMCIAHRRCVQNDGKTDNIHTSDKKPRPDYRLRNYKFGSIIKKIYNTTRIISKTCFLAPNSNAPRRPVSRQRVLSTAHIVFHEIYLEI